MTLHGLTRDSVEELVRELERARRALMNTARQRLPQNQFTRKRSDIFIGKSNSEIPAASGNTPGQALAVIYRIDRSGELVTQKGPDGADLTKTVYNPGSTPIAADSFFEMAQETNSKKLIATCCGGLECDDFISPLCVACTDAVPSQLSIEFSSFEGIGCSNLNGTYIFDYEAACQWDGPIINNLCAGTSTTTPMRAFLIGGAGGPWILRVEVQNAPDPVINFDFDFGIAQPDCSIWSGLTLSMTTLIPSCCLDAGNVTVTALNPGGFAPQDGTLFLGAYEYTVRCGRIVASTDPSFTPST